eukprot:380836-Amorphochlora_amoeboformis.AAC.1
MPTAPARHTLAGSVSSSITHGQLLVQNPLYMSSDLDSEDIRKIVKPRGVKGLDVISTIWSMITMS